MDIPTIVLIIGVSRYREENIPDLPGARSDAILFARALRNWCAEPVISLFLNSSATDHVIDKYLENLEKRSENFKFVFYFCGHGMRTLDPFPSSYLMLHDSKISEGACCDGLQLDSLIQKIHRVKACETYLFIDACYLRLNTIIHPNLKEELFGEKFVRKSFFCLLASGNQESFEDPLEDYGYFTQALLKSLSVHRTSNLSSVEIVREIRCALEQKKLPIPEMYNIDTQEMGFLPSTLLSTVQNSCIHRTRLVAEVQDILVRLQSNILILTGEAGIGKTCFVQQLASDPYQVFYLSLDPMESHLEALDQAIKEKFAEMIPDLHIKGAFKERIACVSCFFPAALFILDHLNVGDQESLIRFVSELASLKVKFILVSEVSLKSLLPSTLEESIHEWHMPPFTLEEAEHLAESAKNFELVYLAGRGNPKRVLESISLNFPTGFSKEELNRTIIALYSARAFIDENLFCQVFRLNRATLAFFKEAGLISWQEAAWCTHDFLSEFAHANGGSVDRITALRYWCQQFAQIEQDPLVAQRLIRAILRLGYEFEAETAMQQAIFQLFQQGKESLPDLIDAAAIFSDREVVTEASLLLVDCLMDLGEFDVPRQLLALKPLSAQSELSTRLRKVHFFWRVGLFEEAIEASSLLLEATDERSALALVYFHRGNARFLSGSLIPAQEDFSQAMALTKERNLLSWSKCMLGTIAGQCDTNISKARKFLLAGIHSSLKCEDLRGVWLGWNNLGELSWKTEDYSQARSCLEKAVELSDKLGILSMQLETLRNLFHLTLRTEGPFGAGMTSLFSKMMRFDISDCENDVKVQLFNTLATVHIFRGEIRKAMILMNILIKLTTRVYPHYHVFTLGNLALLFHYHKKREKADAYLARAVALARKYKHFLAIRQVQEDFNHWLRCEILSGPKPASCENVGPRVF